MCVHMLCCIYYKLRKIILDFVSVKYNKPLARLGIYWGSEIAYLLIEAKMPIFMESRRELVSDFFLPALIACCTLQSMFAICSVL